MPGFEDIILPECSKTLECENTNLDEFSVMLIKNVNK